MSNAGDLIRRLYGGFRGADFRGEEINIHRSPDCLNVWRDYKETDSIRTRPGMEVLHSFEDPVYGIYFYGGDMIVHSGMNLYRMKNGERELIYAWMNPAPSQGFLFDNYWYVKDGRNYLRYDGHMVDNVEGYIPTTSIARKPSGGGTVHEDVNMLSDLRKNSFLADGESHDYYLDAMNIDHDYTPVVTISGEIIPESSYDVDYEAGCIRFHGLPLKPETDGQDNVVIQFKKTNREHRGAIEKCSLLQVFDNRVFFSGNDDKPNVVWHCSLDDPTYVSDLDYYRDGIDTAAINGIVAGNNALWVFREPSEANTTVFYHTPTIDAQFGKIYPSVHSSITTGCVGKAINFNDDIVFFSERGMEGISGDVTTEQMVAHRSTLVDRRMTAEAGYKNMILEEWEGYLLAFIGNHVYLADSRGMFANGNHTEYEWFYWDLGMEIICTRVESGVLYLGTADGVYTLTDTDANVESFWVTPKDKFDNPHKLKTSHKRGCVAEAKGDIDVYAKVEDTDFEYIGTYTDVEDYFVSRIKRKKFKDIQLKFHSKTRFSLETVTLEAFIGGYIKR
jgi:hypothetical protein